ncbi:MAG: indolepyruvate ferredoxin oxidoreductase family protein, partial [Pseudomonas sp.]|nr:indolepyruvate ferredoxin oxidoreductase family protein [Pseudomonas sp.]
ARVQQFRDAETRIAGEPGKLTETVARNYFKVLATKDEYEVARLFTNGDFMKKIEAQFEGNYKLNFHLAPPIMNNAKPGEEPKKRSFGPWMMRSFKLLARMKFLRNSIIDPFGYTAERKVEREWLAIYEGILDEVLEKLSAEKLPIAIELTNLPDIVRGYGPVKERYLDQAHAQHARLLSAWRNEQKAQFHDATTQDARIQATQL